MSWQIGIFYFIVAAVLAVGSIISVRRFKRERVKNMTRLKFKPYMTPRMIEKAMGESGTVRVQPERRVMSVLFSDIRGFTGLSEKMPPEEAVGFLNRYFDRMSNLIFRSGGTLDKFLGDGVMSFWGHPLEMRNHALRATVCALEMVHAVEDLRASLMLPGGARFEIGIGVHTGAMVVGDIGSTERMAYTVIGDSVDLAAWLESVSRHYGARIVISSAVYEASKDVVFCRELDTIQVKDDIKAVTIYEPLGLRRLERERRLNNERRGPSTMAKRAVRAYVRARHNERRQTNRRAASERLFVTPLDQDIAAKYAEALALYRAGDLDAACAAFDRVLLLNPADGPSRLMKQRIARGRWELEEHESVRGGRAASLSAPALRKG